MSTFNVAMKVGGGGSISLTAAGAVLTTTTNQYAKVKLNGSFVVSGTGRLELRLAGVTVWARQVQNPVIGYLAPGGLDPSDYMEFLVPPNTAFTINTVNVTSMTVTGMYVLIENAN